MSFTASLEEIVRENRNGLLSAAPHWRRVALGRVATILNGFPFPSAKFTKDRGTPLLRIRDVLSESTDACFDGGVDPQFLVSAGELVVGMDGDFNAALWRGPVAALNQRVCKISPNEAVLQRKFLAYVLPGYLSAINEYTSAITVKHLSSRTIAEIPLPLPPLAEQRRIVAALEEYLSELDAAVAGLERVRANLGRYRASVYAAAVRGILSEDDGPTVSHAVVKEPFELPEGWSWSELGAHLTAIEAGASFKCEERPPESGETGVIKVSAVTWGTFDDAESKTVTDDSRIDARLLVRTDDFLFSRANTINLVGACVIVERVTRRVMLSDKILRFHWRDLLPAWALVCLRSDWGRREIERLATGNQESMRNIGQERIRAIRIPVPPTDVQPALVEEVDRRLSAAARGLADIDSQLLRATRLRHSILKHAFEGKLVPQDLNDEPASVLLDRIRAERASAAPGAPKSRPKPKTSRKATRR